MGATCTGGTRQRRADIPEGLVRINRQGDDLHIETQNVAPPDSRIELISSSEATGMLCRARC
ncbi:hypothetical protein ACLB1M_17545 [Escherichia coli]